MFQVLLPCQNHGMAAPPGNGGDLRMVGGADDHRLAALLLRPGHDLVDAGHVGTGGVQDAGAPLFQAAVGLPALSVGADDDAAALGHLLRALHHIDALLSQTPDHVAVVDDIAQHDAGFPLGGGLFGQLYRPLPAVAEAGGFGQDHLHWMPSPRAWMRSMTSLVIWSSSSAVAFRPWIWG